MKENKQKIIGLINKALGANSLDEAMFSSMGIRHSLRSNEILKQLKKIINGNND